jgi:alpha-beta hydrolase superfamily lysophospholipase
MCGRRRALRWGLIAVAAIVLCYALAGFALTSFLIGNNARWRGMDRGPGDYGLAAETVSFVSTDGVRLRAWWIPTPTQALGSVVIAHGVDHTRQVMLERAAFLMRAGYNVLAVDLRGHGESGGEVVSPGVAEANDILSAAHWARAREPHAPVAVLGVSYGAVAALFAAARTQEFAALVVDGAFPTGGTVYRRIVSHYIHDRSAPVWLRAACAAAAAPGMARVMSLAYRVRTGLDLGTDLGSVVSVAPRVHSPVLMISGGADWVVPLADAAKLRAALTNTQTTQIVIPRAKHDTTYSTAPDTYQAAVLGFLNRRMHIADR